MIKYYIYNFDSETFNEVSKDFFYSAMRLYKSTQVGFTQESVWRYTDGKLIKEKRLIGNSVYYEKVS